MEIELSEMSQQLQERFKPRMSPQKNQKQKKPTRKKKQITRTTFNHTQLGDFLRKNCPEEYELIVKAKTEGASVTADLVETIAYRSDNPSFQSVTFRKALSDYRRYKCKTPNQAHFDLDAEVAAIKRRLRLTDNAEIL